MIQKYLSPLLLFQGAGGIGKSTSLKHISLSWANGESEQLKQFDFVFHIALKFVKQNQTLEEMIVEQHKVLKMHKSSQREIRLVLEGETSKKTLILLDGYDEYRKGTSPHVDSSLLRESLPCATILITSRDNKEVTELKPHMDIEAEITGFDPERVEEYITKYFGNERMSQKLISLVNMNLLSRKEECEIALEEAKESEIKQAFFLSRCIFRRNNSDSVTDFFGILQVPIMLHMICVLFQRETSLPKTRTGVISAIVERCPDWEEIRKSGNKTTDEWKQVLEATLERLGELAWERLEKGNKDLVFTKVSFGIKWRNMS